MSDSNYDRENELFDELNDDEYEYAKDHLEKLDDETLRDFGIETYYDKVFKINNQPSGNHERVESKYKSKKPKQSVKENVFTEMEVKLDTKLDVIINLLGAGKKIPNVENVENKDFEFLKKYLRNSYGDIEVQKSLCKQNGNREFYKELKQVLKILDGE